MDTMQHAEAFRAMNTDIDLFVESFVPPFDAFLSIRLLFEDQERRFSRFLPGSLLSALNRGEVVEDVRFARACRLALQAYELTGGLFNPMVLPALVDAGYDRSFDDLGAAAASGAPRAQPVPDPREAIAFDGDRLTLVAGALDLGGIVKGWTVDLASELARDRYPDHLINAGGDLRANGSEEAADGWRVSLDDLAGQPAWEGEVNGALATSSTQRRRWRSAGGGQAHHLIDPRSGLPAVGTFAQVSVWAPECWLAEVWAKAVLIGGQAGVEACQRAGLTLMAFPPGGEVAGGEESAG